MKYSRQNVKLCLLRKGRRPHSPIFIPGTDSSEASCNLPMVRAEVIHPCSFLCLKRAWKPKHTPGCAPTSDHTVPIKPWVSMIKRVIWTIYKMHLPHYRYLQLEPMNLETRGKEFWDRRHHNTACWPREWYRNLKK